MEKVNDQPNNPLQGKTLQAILEYLHKEYGWEEMGKRIRIKCFIEKPSIASSLKFLRKTAWAREKVEGLYLETISRHYRTPANGDLRVFLPNDSGSGTNHVQLL